MKNYTLYYSKYPLFFFLAILFNNTVLANPTLSTASQQLQNGFYRAALSSYQQIYQDADTLKKQQLAEAGIGNVFYLLNQPQQAIIHLRNALVLSNGSNKIDNGKIHYYLSLVYGQLKDNILYNDHRKKAMEIAGQQSNYLLQTYLQLTSLKLAANKEQFNLSLNRLEELLRREHNKSPEWGIIHLNLAKHLINHNVLDTLNTNDRQRIQASYQHLKKAGMMILKTTLRPQSQLAGLKSVLYETDKRYQEALVLSLKALNIAQKISAQDLLILYEWQTGRLYKKLNENKKAIDSYRRSVSYVKAIRQDIPVQYQDGKSSFKELLEPLYLDLADLLLQDAAQKTVNEKQIILSEARDLLEQLKQTELEDFFQDRCLIEEGNQFYLDQVSLNTAVLYPVLLENRFEWLISIKGHLEQIQLPLSRKKLDSQIRTYTSGLRNKKMIKDNKFFNQSTKENQLLYQSLFKPLELFLQQQKIKTLVYIPDGVFRLLPLNVLFDGQQYLIERYAIATIPGLNLLNKQKKSKFNKSLLAGLSKPTVKTISNLPMSLLTRLTGYTLQEIHKQQDLVKKTRSINVDITDLLTNQRELKKNNNFKVLAKEFALPGVATEINHLEKSLPNKTLLNQQFTLTNFQKQVEENDYSIIHIASHAFFRGDSKDSFIMTYDKPLTINKLEDLLQKRNPDNPIDILTLSACQTAEGDDRAPLGFSGVAIKANAQTALGSLWPINDGAAVKLMKNFYYQLVVEGQTKAKSLQIAQQELINNPKMSNPFYWAPFILVGHWL